jgi:hypothetical protein
MFWKEFGIHGYTQGNTVIFDDNEEVYEIQPGNCIIALPFEFLDNNSENDNYLSKVREMLKEIKIGNDPAEKINESLLG